MTDSRACADWFPAALLRQHHLNTDMRRSADTLTISAVLIQSEAVSRIIKVRWWCFLCRSNHFIHSLFIVQIINTTYVLLLIRHSPWVPLVTIWKRRSDFLHWEVQRIHAPSQPYQKSGQPSHSFSTTYPLSWSKGSIQNVWIIQ